MKRATLLTLFSITFFTLNCGATAVFTTVWDTGSGTKVVAIIQAEYELHPVVYRYPNGDGAVFPVVRPVVVHVDSQIPSILLGSEIGTFSQDDVALFLTGTDIRDLNFATSDGWLRTHWLSWIYVLDYPTVYSPTLGWIFLLEIDEERYAIYNFAANTWTIRDFLEEWTRLPITNP